MDMQKVAQLAQIPQPFTGTPSLVEDLRAPLSYHFAAGQGCPAGECTDCLAQGVELHYTGLALPNLETAIKSLRRVLAAKGVAERASSWPITWQREESFQPEEFELSTTSSGAVIKAANEDGFRRGTYFLEERLAEAEGQSVTAGSWRRKPFVKHRISRCFFGPTYRAPFFIDELSNDIDYYPEEYLNKLAHEGINGLWLTMYFWDLPSSVFPGRGAKAEQRFAKLRLTVERCARYGIRIYVFFSEPKLFADASYAVPAAAAEKHPELIGSRHGDWGFFCTSTAAGKQYLHESVAQLFSTVPGLGGMINIMYGEDNGSCVAHRLGRNPICKCPRCSQQEPGQIFRQQAEIMRDAMRASSPEAEFLGWFYAPGQRDGSLLSQQLAEVSRHWPDDICLMLNFESGGHLQQLGKERVIFDYSLAYLGPSELFREVARTVKKPAAKLQVGCSHENASVPFIPVPGNLYEKYKVMHELGVYAAMQCWYFGNYPGLMNQAAGRLSFEPFPASEEEFLLELARPAWRRFAPQVAQAWRHFATGYRNFPGNLSFEWYGPLHHCIAWPLHLFPVDQPIAPSWLLQQFPEVSGDRIGECLTYHHTLSEGLELCRMMASSWEKGFRLLEPLRTEFQHDPQRLADIDLAEAILLQMQSTRNLLEFYHLREDMLYTGCDNLESMREIVQKECRNTERMAVLCRRDCRLGYHSEAEGYLFFPAKLEARLELLHELLEKDFPRFRLDAAWIGAYTGSRPEGKVACCGSARDNAPRYPLSGKEPAGWAVWRQGDTLVFSFTGLTGTVFCLEIEPCRLWPPMRFDITAEGKLVVYDGIFRQVPVLESHQCASETTIAVPLALMDGYRRPGHPVRVNVRGKGFSWVEGEDYENRLMQRDYNPAKAGWLQL